MGVTGWARTPAQNATADRGIAAQDGASARSTAPSLRAVMAAARRFADDQGGALKTSGDLNAYGVTTGSGLTELRAGLSLLTKIHRTNTAQATLNADGLGPLPWVDAGGVPLKEGRLIEGRFYASILDTLADGSAVAWRVQAGASTLDEIPGLLEARQEASAAAATATSKASEADSSAATATQKAGEAQTNADLVSSKVGEATAAAATATAQAGTASTAATAATSQAATATAQASLANTRATQAQNAVATGRITRDALPLASEWQGYADGAQLEVLSGADAGLYLKSGAPGGGTLTFKSKATVTGNADAITRLRKTFILPGYSGRLTLSSTNGRIVDAPGRDVADLKARPLPTASRALNLPDKANGRVALSSTNGKALSPGPLRSGGIGATQIARDPTATALGGGLRTHRLLRGPKAPIILITIGGQSLSLRGGIIIPQLFTTTALSSNVVMPSPGVAPMGQTWSELVPAFEKFISSAGETGYVRLADGIRLGLASVLGADVMVAVVVTGAGGTPISSLSAGTVTGEETALNIQRVADAARAMGRECWHIADLWIHGNDDTYILPQWTYERRLFNRHDWLADLSARLTQRPPSMRFVTYTTQVDIALSTTPFCSLGGPAAAQLSACMNSRDIRWAGTSYPFDHVDGTHMDSRNYYWYAEQNLGLILRDYFGEGIRPFAVHRSYWLSATKIRLEYAVPAPPFVLDTSNLICQTVGIAGYQGLQFDDGRGASSPQPTAITVMDDGSGVSVPGVASSGEWGKAIVDVDLAAAPQAGAPYRRLGIGLGFGSGGGLGFLATGRLNVSGGVAQSFAIDTPGNSWTGTALRACIVSGNAGTSVTDAFVSGGQVTGAGLPSQTGWNANPYVAFLRAGSGRATGARTLFRDSMNLASGLGWDGVLGSTAHPRVIHNWAAHQLLEM